MFGDTPGLFATTKTYTSVDWVYQRGATRTAARIYHPSGPWFEQAYPNALPNAKTGTTTHIVNSHIANGLFINTAGGNRFVFFSSARVLQFDVSDATSPTLLFDHPFITRQTRNIGGRNYGLVAVDPEYERLTAAPHLWPAWRRPMSLSP